MSSTRTTPGRAAAALLAVAVAALATGCMGSSARGDAATTGASKTINPSDIAPGDGVFSRSLGGTLDLTVTGAINATWKGATPLRIVHSASGSVPQAGWLLSVGLEEPVAAFGGVKVRPAFDVVGYTGDGDYRVAAKQPGGTVREGADEGEAISGALRSTAFLVVTREGSAETRNFEVIQQACTVAVADKGLSGSVDCPANTDTVDTIAFRWTWKADPNQVLHDDSTPSGGTTRTPGSDGGGSGGPGAAADGPLPEPTMRGDLPMKVSLNTECATIGQRVDVTIETEPGAAVTVASAFSDARPHGLHELGTADARGRYRWSFVVPPDAPPGNAYVLVAANEAEGQRSAGATNPFRVEAVSC